MSKTRVIRARWVLPIDRPPIRDGWIEIDQGRIAAVGAGESPGRADDLGDVAILPGLVNAHTHLELSWMAGRIPPSDSMDEWILALMALRKGGAPESVELDAARDAAGAMRATGTALVGDISNTLRVVEPLADAGLGGVVFHELTGFRLTPSAAAATVREAWTRAGEVLAWLDTRGAGDLSVSVVAHAPYSVSPELFRVVVAQAGRAPLSVHLAESAEEVELLRHGKGRMRAMLEALGAWTPAWPVPGCDPAEYLERLGYLKPGTLIMHGVHLTADGLDRLRRAGAILVTCPRSNTWVGAGSPNLAQFFDSGVPVAIGTDSLASVQTLNLFDELQEIRRLAPEVSAASLLESATRVGADALGLGERYGTLAPGKRAALVAVRVPADVSDVEEYLVGGIAASDISML